MYLREELFNETTLTSNYSQLDVRRIQKHNAQTGCSTHHFEIDRLYDYCPTRKGNKVI